MKDRLLDRERTSFTTIAKKCGRFTDEEVLCAAKNLPLGDLKAIAICVSKPNSVGGVMDYIGPWRRYFVEDGPYMYRLQVWRLKAYLRKLSEEKK